jgi:hypothetical protein
MSDRRRALIQIPADDLEQLLDLPDGYEVAFIGSDFLRQAVVIAVSSDALEPVAECCEPPLLGGLFSQRRVVVDGEVFFRWVWTLEASR